MLQHKVDAETGKCTSAVRAAAADLESELLAGPEVVDPVGDDMVYADPDVAEGQQVLLPQLHPLLHQVVVVLQVQHCLQATSLALPTARAQV